MSSSPSSAKTPRVSSSPRSRPPSSSWRACRDPAKPPPPASSQPGSRRAATAPSSSPSTSTAPPPASSSKSSPSPSKQKYTKATSKPSSPAHYSPTTTLISDSPMSTDDKPATSP